MNQISIVVGGLYGDEGKGATVNALCLKANNPLVIRHNSGQQSGHSVVVGDKKHVFSNFGSGSLLNIPTYWSEYCTVYPIGVFREEQALKILGVKPKVFYDANAMVTTPFDIIQNLNFNAKNNHGTVGVGFGTTIQRNEDHYHLYVRDLQYSKVRDEKLKNILKYYGYAIPLNSVSQKYYDEFINACNHLINSYEIIDGLYNMLDMDLIFEGSQGIMLDTKHGFFPHVTRSNTTAKNAIEIIKKYNLEQHRKINTYYIIRAYQTRHGNGFISNEDIDNSFIKINPFETNIDTGIQGKFRRTVLDLDILKYAISCDYQYNKSSNKILIITCLDHVGNEIPITENNKLLKLSPFEISKKLDINCYYIANNDNGVLF